jgi:hypothetical protein
MDEADLLGKGIVDEAVKPFLLLIPGQRLQLIQRLQ